jgi:hypothetical protein
LIFLICPLWLPLFPCGVFVPWSVWEFEPDPGDGAADDIVLGVDVGIADDIAFGVAMGPIVGFAVGATGIDVDDGMDVEEGIDVDDGIGEDCADATPVAASARAAAASISRLVCCMLEAPMIAGKCLSGAVFPQPREIDACSV